VGKGPSQTQEKIYLIFFASLIIYVSTDTAGLILPMTSRNAIEYKTHVHIMVCPILSGDYYI
jgi:hypothetical protein